MGLLKTTEFFNRDDLPEETKRVFLELKKQSTLIETRNKILEIENNKLKKEVEDQRKTRKSIESRISINSKTGLPNHHKLNQDINLLLEQAQEKSPPSPFAVFIIKLDKNYDIVNKTLKYSMSEWVMYSIGSRLKDFCQESGHLYHTRDDEFIALITGMKISAGAKEIAEEIYGEVSKPHIFSGYHISIGCHIGVSLFPQHGIQKRALLHSADIALGYARDSEITCQVFTAKLKDKVIEKMELQNCIIKALEAQAINEINKQFDLYYQPVVKIKEQQNGALSIYEIHGETLIRWNHPTKGFINPEKFIPVSEETGLIVPIGNWVLYSALEHMTQWQKEHSKTIPISINISPVQFSNEGFVDSILRIIEKRGFAARHLTLEITEGCVMEDPIESTQKIKRLHDAGISISIDDFGKGYSSLNYLRLFPLDTLKIDKSFIKDIVTNTFDRAIVRAVISMAGELDFNIVVEGVENRDQFSVLYEEGCSCFQGYLFSKPLKHMDFPRFYQENLNREIIFPKESSEN